MRDGKRNMENAGQTTDRIEALRALMDRLVSPDLTLGEAKVLRCHLLTLTGEGRDGYVALGTAPRPRPLAMTCEGRHSELQFAGCRSCAA
jgi:hypothetical protein